MKKVYKKITALAATFLSAPLLSAQIMPSGMTGLVENVKEVFTGPFVRALLVIFLCGSAIAYGFNKDNEKIKRNCIAIGVACAILVAASGIVDAVWTASKG